MQFFIIEKEYPYVIPMKPNSDVPQVLQAFAQAIAGAPDMTICAGVGEPRPPR